MNTPKYKIGETLDTEACGECVVKDVFISPMSGKVAYEVEVADDMGTLIYTEEHLE